MLNQADRLLRNFFSDFFKQHLKGGVSGSISLVNGSAAENPVTQYDLLLGEKIEETLNQLDVGPVVTEESIDQASGPFSRPFWLVDPIDGTKEFSQRIPECASSVALIDPIKNEVTYAALFDLMRGEFYSTLDNPNTPIQTTPKPHLLFSRSETKQKLDRYLVPLSDVFESITPVGSIAYKMLAVYRKPHDVITISLQPKHLWDVAGGYGLLQKHPFIKVTDLSGNKIDFSKGLKEKINGVIVAPKNIHEISLKKLLEQNADKIPDSRAT